MLDAFLAVETRQVWALDRATNAPVFLEDGAAEVMRARTRTGLRCPVPDCTGPITTVGGIKRHHFRHLSDFEHRGATETLNHEEAKWMVAAWFEEHSPVGTVVRVERQAPGTSRIADVLVQTLGQRPLAVEVEYKSFSVGDALSKREEYEGAGVDCLWLLGHTRVSRLEASEVVGVPAFATALVNDGATLLVVNPSTKQIGTLRSLEFGGHYAWTAGTNWAHLEIDELDDCWHRPADPWLVAPTWVLIEGDEAARRAAEESTRREVEERTRVAEERRLERLREQADRRQAQAERRDGQSQPFARDDPSMSFASKKASADPSVFGVHPSVWRRVIFDAVIHGKANWTAFGWREIRSALNHAEIGMGKWDDRHFGAIRAYLTDLEADGWMFIVSSTEFAASGKPASGAEPGNP